MNTRTVLVLQFCHITNWTVKKKEQDSNQRVMLPCSVLALCWTGGGTAGRCTTFVCFGKHRLSVLICFAMCLIAQRCHYSCVLIARKGWRAIIASSLVSCLWAHHSHWSAASLIFSLSPCTSSSPPSLYRRLHLVLSPAAQLWLQYRVNRVQSGWHGFPAWSELYWVRRTSLTQRRGGTE